MRGDIKSIVVQMRVFQDFDGSGRPIIKLAWPGKDHISWITDYQCSEKRYHPNLYRKLKDTLIDAGKWDTR
jgi:hypothetical protein